MAERNVGEKEMALLQFVAAKGPTSVGRAAEEFGAPRALARSTVLTMMERLRQKGRLKRRRAGGVYEYYSPASSDELTAGAVRRFVDATLGGSVSPVVTFLAEREQVSDEELAELDQLVARLKSKRKGE
jgi:predicted transcriptional regulator